MHVLVTGATGFLGRHIVAALKERGDTITVTSRDVEKASRVLGADVRPFAWDYRGEDFPAEALEGVDAVIHLMGENVGDGRWTDSRKIAIRESRVMATAKLVAGLPDSVRVFLASSAIAYYPSSDTKVFAESDEAQARGFLGGVVHEWEERIRAAGENDKRRVAWFRIGLVLGHQGLLAQLLPMFRWGLGGNIGDGRSWVSWIHIDDQIRMIMQALDNEKMSGPLNGVAPGLVRYDEFAKTIARLLRRPSFFTTPRFVLKLALGEASELPLSSIAMEPVAASAAGFEFKYRELEPALASLIRSRD